MKRSAIKRRLFVKTIGYGTVAVAIAPVVACTGGDGDGDSETDGDTGGAPVNMEWEDRAAELETGSDGNPAVWDANDPGPWPDKVGSHVPTVTMNEDGTVTLSTMHEMTAEHWITTHYIRDQDGTVIGLHEYAVEDGVAEHTFTLHETTTSFVAYQYCNLHDMWKDT